MAPDKTPLQPSDIADLLDYAKKKIEKLSFIHFGDSSEKLVLCTVTRELYRIVEDKNNPILYVTDDYCDNNFYLDHPNLKDKKQMANARHIKGGSKGPMLGHVGIGVNLLIYNPSN